MAALTNTDLLALLEGYYDEAPRALANAEEHGPLTLFLTSVAGGWPYYARPRLGLAEPVTAADVDAVRARQRELGVPEAIEWVHETTPSLRAAVEESGLPIEDCPLLVLDGEPIAQPTARPSAAEVRWMSAEDPGLNTVRAAIAVGFDHESTDSGAAGAEARDAWAAQNPETGPLVGVLEAGLSVMLGAFDAEVGAVGGGSHNPREVGTTSVSEVVGVGVLPAYRRRGIAAHLSAELARHALDNGASTVFCSAAGDDVARIYESVGFRRVGTALIAEAL